MKFVLAGGGTGGHAYPALAVAEVLRRDPDVELVYYGTPRGAERSLAEQAAIAFREVPAAQVRGRSPVRLARGLFHLWRGTRVARRWLRQDRPAAVFATGGYAAAPVGRAAAMQGIPVVVFLPDAHPGWAVKFLARYATTVACAVDPAAQHFAPGQAVVTGYPLRRQFAEATREEGVRRFDLHPSMHTVLVAGGSLGAHQVNLAIARSLRDLLEQAQLIHIAGRDEEPWLTQERERLPDWLRARYHLYAYTDEMAYAMAAADLAVMRAGASTLGELPASRLPAILIPGGFSDQHVNATYLAERDAAVVLTSSELDRLVPLITELLTDDARRGAMAKAMCRLARPDATERLAALVREVAA